MNESGRKFDHRRTARLLLRPPAMDDLAFLTDLFSRPETVAHRPVPVSDSPEQSAARLVDDMNHWNEHGFGRWAVEAEDALVGFGGVTVSRAFEALNMSYHLHPSVWGRGYASELAQAALRFAFDDLHADTVIGLARPANPASRRVLEKCGFILVREVMLHGAPTNLFRVRRPGLPEPGEVR